MVERLTIIQSLHCLQLLAEFHSQTAVFLIEHQQWEQLEVGRTWQVFHPHVLTLQFYKKKESTYECMHRRRIVMEITSVHTVKCMVILAPLLKFPYPSPVQFLLCLSNCFHPLLVSTFGSELTSCIFWSHHLKQVWSILNCV